MEGRPFEFCLCTVRKLKNRIETSQLTTEVPFKVRTIVRGLGLMLDIKIIVEKVGDGLLEVRSPFTSSESLTHKN